jgi:hypothetical protein
MRGVLEANPERVAGNAEPERPAQAMANPVKAILTRLNLMGLDPSLIDTSLSLKMTDDAILDWTFVRRTYTPIHRHSIEIKKI